MALAVSGLGKGLLLMLETLQSTLRSYPKDFLGSGVRNPFGGQLVDGPGSLVVRLDLDQRPGLGWGGRGAGRVGGVDWIHRVRPLYEMLPRWGSFSFRVCWISVNL